ncbi:curli production assembly/transport protein CsgE [Shewanella colwelliana]|uniref:curli production assembly/transport protein CsgE n=1 Tax=Shewanella colwelliana TaxID=23 RepID=UPI0022AEF1A6|nr:curli production assembly/transport protein CsgE [Shewanella colwelliana]MCZ4337033.1 curli production assembly/transport protein CsgE [Shewanella colwelliana]
MNHRFGGLVFLLCCVTAQAEDTVIGKAPQVQQQNISDALPKQESDLIDGLILNRAMTRVGHRFYREFVAAYRDIGGMTQHSGLSVVERATARSGSKVLILHNRKPVYITVISPASRDLDKQAVGAAKRVNQVLMQNQKQSSWAQWLDPDLAPDEF